MSAELAKALVRAQSSFPAIAKTREVEVTTKTGGKYRFKYAPLEDVLSAVQKPLADNGLAISQLLSTLPGEPPLPSLRTLLLHESGDALESEVPLPTIAHGSPQELGSVITYLRRYAVVSLLGIATEEDDDGNVASGNMVSRSAGAPSTASSGQDRAASERTDGTPAGDSAAEAAPAENPAEVARQAQEQAKAARAPEDDGRPENVLITFGKHKGSPLGQVPRGYLEWLVGTYEAKTAEQRRLVAAASVLIGAEQSLLPTPDDSIPF